MRRLGPVLWTVVIPAVVALLVVVLGAASSRASGPSLIVFAADRAPSLSGEVYRLDSSGRLTDLSKSPYPETSPLVSPDGKMVAFFRGGSVFGSGFVRVSVYEVGIGGGGLVRIGPSLAPQGQSPQLAWQPHGGRLALTGSVHATITMSLWILQRGRTPLKILTSRNGVLSPSWSPDGRVLLARANEAWRAFSASGRYLWNTPRAPGCPACYARWSSRGLLAVTTQRSVTVYDEKGRLRFQAPGNLFSGPAWSPSGRWLASVVGRTLQVRTATGALVLRKTLRGLGSLSTGQEGGITWAGEGRVAISGWDRGAPEFRGVLVPSGKAWRPSSRWFQPRSGDGKLAILTPPSGQEFALGVAPAGGGALSRYANVPGCYDHGDWIPAAQSLQFVGRGRSILYASYCPEPFSHLYSMSPDGSGLRQITSGRSYETEPVLSPDGSKIAYSWAQYTGLGCRGCPSQIRIANADGTAVRVLTDPPVDTYDSSPTWSPDGKTILFTRASNESAEGLFTVPATGGPVHDLDITGSQPAWGPSRIAMVYVQDGVWTDTLDGSDPEQVDGCNSSPAWSSDGQLACLSGTNGTTLVVGTSKVHPSWDPASIGSLAWSTDNTHFVITAQTSKPEPLDLYTIRTDGTNPTRLTRNYNTTSASWR